MEQKALAKWLKAVLIGVAICMLIVYCVIIPSYGVSLRSQNPEFAYCFWPWLIFLWGTALPCCAALVLGWRIASGIGLGRSFTAGNARSLKWIAFLAAGDAAYFFVGNLSLVLLNMSHPGIALLSLLAVFAGVAVSVAAGALSHLVRKAVALQEQSDLTI